MLRIALVAAGLALTAGSATADRIDEHVRPPEPRPCKCKRHYPSPGVKLLSTRTEVSRRVAQQLSSIIAVNDAMKTCGMRGSAELTLTFTEGARDPRVTVKGQACWREHRLAGFTPVKSRLVVKLRVAPGPSDFYVD